MSRGAKALQIVFVIAIVIAGLLVAGGGASRAILRNAVSVYWFPLFDKPSDASQMCVTPILHNHYFSDFQSEFCRLRHDRVYREPTLERGFALLETPTSLESHDAKIELRHNESSTVKQSFEVAALETAEDLGSRERSLILRLVTRVNQGTVSVNDARDAIAAAENTPSSRQFPSFFIFLLPFLLFGSTAMAFWWALSIVLLGTVTVALYFRKELSWFWPAIFPFLHALYRGNFPWIVAGLFVMIWVVRKDDKWGWTLIILASLLKPPLLLFSLWYFITGKWSRVVAAIGMFSFIQLSASIIIFGDPTVFIKPLLTALSGSQVLGAGESGIGFRSDVSVLLAFFTDYMQQGEVPAVISSNAVLAVGPLLILFMYIAILSFTHLKMNTVDEKRFSMFVLSTAAVVVLAAGPSFLYSLCIVAGTVSALKVSGVYRGLAALSMIPIWIPLPLATRDVMDLYEPNGYNFMTSQSWTLGALISSIALLLIVVLGIRSITFTPSTLIRQNATRAAT